MGGVTSKIRIKGPFLVAVSGGNKQKNLGKAARGTQEERKNRKDNLSKKSKLMGETKAPSFW